jgi:hypothetical protein
MDQINYLIKNLNKLLSFESKNSKDILFKKPDAYKNINSNSFKIYK